VFYRNHWKEILPTGNFMTGLVREGGVEKENVVAGVYYGQEGGGSTGRSRGRLSLGESQLGG